MSKVQIGAAFVQTMGMLSKFGMTRFLHHPKEFQCTIGHFFAFVDTGARVFQLFTAQRKFLLEEKRQILNYYQCMNKSEQETALSIRPSFVDTLFWCLSVCLSVYVCIMSCGYVDIHCQTACIQKHYIIVELVHLFLHELIFIELMLTQSLL